MINNNVSLYNTTEYGEHVPGSRADIVRAANSGRAKHSAKGCSLNSICKKIGFNLKSDDSLIDFFGGNRVNGYFAKKVLGDLLVSRPRRGYDPDSYIEGVGRVVKILQEKDLTPVEKYRMMKSLNLVSFYLFKYTVSESMLTVEKLKEFADQERFGWSEEALDAEAIKMAEDASRNIVKIAATDFRALKDHPSLCQVHDLGYVFRVTLTTPRVCKNSKMLINKNDIVGEYHDGDFFVLQFFDEVGTPSERPFVYAVPTFEAATETASKLSQLFVELQTAILQWKKDHKEKEARLSSLNATTVCAAIEACEKNRIGEKAASVNPQNFMERFGLKNAQFGESISSPKEQKAWLKATFEAFQDLAQVLEIEDSDVRFFFPSIAWGARGRGGRSSAAAHYELYRQIINLTRKHGIGSAAHEAGHSFDSFLYEAYLEDNDLARNSRKHPQISYFADEIRRGSIIVPDEVKELVLYLDEKDTLYSKMSKKADGGKNGYYSVPTEKFARAFACFVQDSLRDSGMCNGFLVDTFGQINPTGEDREKIDQLFANMFARLKKDGVLHARVVEEPEPEVELIAASRIPSEPSFDFQMDSDGQFRLF